MSMDATSPRSGEAPLRRSPGKFIPELDGIRGLAILGVMALHFFGGITPTTIGELTVVTLSGYGVWGVDLFFVLSGFLITGILLGTKGAPGYFKNFYIRRTLRIFPLYYTVLTVLFLLPMGALARFDASLSQMQSVQGWVWPYLTNYYLAPQTSFSIPYVSHFWSLAVEEHFYLLWPIVILLLSRRAALWGCALFSVTALVLRIGFESMAPDALYAGVLTPCRLDALCIGAWFAIARRGHAPLDPARLGRWAAAACGGVLAISVWHVLNPQFDAIALELRETFLAILFGSSVYAAAYHPGLTRTRAMLRAPWLRTLGKYSYGLYVFHGVIAYFLSLHPLVPALHALVGNHTLAAAMQVAIGLAVSLLISVASYELFERRFLVLKDRFANFDSAATWTPAHGSTVTDSPAQHRESRRRATWPSGWSDSAGAT
jgi:peptidoglycan/LPS O-acetylase OafA/YrhL